MKNLKYIALATVIGAWALAATTFADDSNMNNDSMDSMKGKPMMMHDYGSMSGAQMGSGMEMKKWWQIMIEKYFKTDLTDADKAAIATIKSNNEVAMKALMETMKPTNNSWATQTDMQTKMADMITKMKALHEDFVNALLPYIATDKVDEFKTAMTKMEDNMWKMQSQNKWWERGKRKEGNTETNSWQTNDKYNRQGKNPQNTVTLPASINTAIDAKLAAITTDAEKLAWLNAVNTKIDILLTKSLSAKSVALLNALKWLINDKIDVINWTGVDSNSILNILQ